MTAHKCRIAVMLALQASLICACTREGSMDGARETRSDPARTDTAISAGVDPRRPEHVFETSLRVRLIDVPEEVKAGQTATAAFAARPESSCQIKIAYADGEMLSQLPPAVVDESGTVRWRWTVPSDATPGTVRAFVVCSGGQRGEAETTIST